MNYRKGIKRIFWPLVSLCLLCYFAIIPIARVGLWSYIGTEKQINPITEKLVNKYLYYRARHLSKRWYERVRRLEEKDLTAIEWQQDTISSQGINSLYCLDQQAEEVRPLLMKEWNLPYDKSLWWNALQTGQYLFNPGQAAPPIYNITRSDSALHIKTGTKYDTWVYLVAKQQQPENYMLEFDFTTHTSCQETLQICFASSSLAQRFRFNLENNKTMKFDVIDHANFLYVYRPDLWKNLRFPYSIPLHKAVNVRLVCQGNKYALYYNRKLVMAVEVKDYKAVPAYWYLIFWNGTPQKDLENKNDNFIDIEISNLKIYHPRKP